MKGIQLSEYVKGPDDLAVSSIADPVPAHDQYLVAVHAAAANFFDILQIQGKYQNQPPFPWVAGAEFSGVVVAAPSGSPVRPRFAVGDRVFGASQGAFATLVCATEAQLQPVPPGWSHVEAAGLFVTAPTSYAALVERAAIKRGDSVLVHAAAGGVGLAAVQTFGATVIATAGSDDKLAVARAFGADHAVNYKTNPDWPAAVRKLTPGGRGVDIVYDPVGLVDKSTKCTAWNGRILVVGFAAGAIEKLALNKVLLKNISIVGIHWGAYAVHEPDAVPLVWAGIRRLIDRGAYRPTVFVDAAQPRRFQGLDHIPATLNALGSRHTWGKVVVAIPQEADSKL